MRYLACVGSLTLLAAVVAAQITPDPRLRYNHDTYHPVMEVLKSKRTPVTDEQLEQLKRLPLEAIWSGVQGLGYVNCSVSGLKSSRPNERLVGRALTIRYLPRRPDVDEAMAALAKEGDWPTRYHVRSAEEAKPGDVIVVDLGGAIADGNFAGDMAALGAKAAGAKGTVIWGASRDLVELQDIEGFPVLAVGFDPRPAAQAGVDWNVPIRVDGVAVLPGDVVVGDAEAVLFFPPQITAEVIKRANQIVEQENFGRPLIREKKYRFRDIYPLSPELRKKMETQRKGN